MTVDHCTFPKSLSMYADRLLVGILRMVFLDDLTLGMCAYIPERTGIWFIPSLSQCVLPVWTSTANDCFSFH